MDATREPLPSEVPTVSEVDEDWRLLREACDRRARDRLIVHYLPFARMLAAKVFSRRTYEELEFADYLQFASVGLIEAVDRFDPARGRFESFAGLRINGAILNGVTGLTERQQQVDVRRRMLESRAASLKESPELSDGQALFDHLADMAIGLAVGFVLDGSGMYRVDDVSRGRAGRGGQRVPEGRPRAASHAACFAGGNLAWQRAKGDRLPLLAANSLRADRHDAGAQPRPHFATAQGRPVPPQGVAG
jgi:RNA polymerase sigma factor (sigma-70 family)